MALSKTIVLLPCHSLEDFPLHLDRGEAEPLLAAWTALWHPALLATTGVLPAWYRADFPPEDASGTLYALPAVAEPLIGAGWVSKATGQGGWVVRKFPNRPALLADVRRQLIAADELPTVAALDSSALDQDLALDFMALGYAFLQVELLTRQMRYMSNLDELQLQREAVAGAKAALEGDNQGARRRLQQCFDLLLDARERFYPADNYLLDLTLVADTTLGAQLDRELKQPLPINLLLTGGQVQRLSQERPEAVEALRKRLEDRTAGFVGGEYGQRALPLLPPEEWLRELLDGRRAYHQALGRWPRVYGRLRFGLSPSLPQALQRLQFDAALHFTLDDGVFPQDRQCKTRWEGVDATALDALTRLPVDANDAATFLRLPQILGETMDLDHVATTTLAHWPGAVSTWYDDLRRATKYAHLFGKFVTIDEFFSNTDNTGRLSQFSADDYRSPYLRQAVDDKESDAISACPRVWQMAAQRTAAECLRAWSAVLGRNAPAANSDEAARAVATSLGGAVDPRHGTLVLNTSGVARHWRPLVEQAAAVEVPAFGFAWVDDNPAAQQTRSSTSRTPPGKDEFRLRNEFLDILVDPVTGGIHAVHAPQVRGNVLTQQLAYRLPTPPPQPGQAWQDPQRLARYTRMQADSLRHAPGPGGVHSVVSHGQLVDETGRTWARFAQRVTLTTGDPVAQVEVSLSEIAPLGADPWTSYVASRLAWNSEDAELFRGVHLAAQASQSRTFEAPDYVELRTDRWRLALLCQGLPYHRRSGERMLDTLLVVRGETCPTFRFGLAVNLGRLAATAMTSDDAALATAAHVPAPPTERGWLFHLDQPNVAITHWEPIMDQGRAVGLRLRVMETTGSPGPVRLHAYCELTGGTQTDFTGEPLAQLRSEEGALRIPLGAFEWAQIEARFAE